MQHFHLARNKGDQLLAIINKTRLESQDGFVLVAAIMALMIFIAVGFYALTVTTGDLRVSGRLVGERKAFSAAEAGVNVISRILNPTAPSAPIIGQKVDPLNDPKAEFDATAFVQDSNIPDMWFPGFSPSQRSAVFRSTVTGRDTGYGSRVRLSVGIASAPASTGTEQGPF